MRVPFTKVYRAFPELEHMPDAECERIVWRVRISRPTPVRLYVAAAVVGVAAWLAVAGLYAVQAGLQVPDLEKEFGRLATLAAVLLGGTVLGGAVAVLLARDLFLWNGVRRHLRRASCPKCKQSLLGLPVQQISIGPPMPGEAWVRCTECGRKVVLMDVGLTPLDLTPWEQREVPPDVAKLRRGGEWVRRGRVRRAED